MLCCVAMHKTGDEAMFRAGTLSCMFVVRQTSQWFRDSVRSSEKAALEQQPVGAVPSFLSRGHLSQSNCILASCSLGVQLRKCPPLCWLALCCLVPEHTRCSSIPRVCQSSPACPALSHLTLQILGTAVCWRRRKCFPSEMEHLGHFEGVTLKVCKGVMLRISPSRLCVPVPAGGPSMPVAVTVLAPALLLLCSHISSFNILDYWYLNIITVDFIALWDKIKQNENQ